MLTGQINQNILFSEALRSTQSQEPETRAQGKLKIFELLKASKVTQISQEDICAAIVLSNNMGDEVINNQNSLDMLKYIFAIPSVQNDMEENAYEILCTTIELGDIDTLDILKGFSEIKSALMNNKDKFIEMAECYDHGAVIEWLADMQKKNKNKLR